MRWAWLLLLVSCGPEDYTSCTPLPYSYRVTCETHPDLCGLSSTTIATANNPRAYRLVVLPEGFRADEMRAFHRHVRELITDLWNDEGGVVEMAPDLFDVAVVDVPSSTTLLANDSRYDTALGGCLRDDEFGGPQPFGTVDPARALLAAQNAGPASAIVVIFADTDPRANASHGVITLGMDDNAKVLTHELGHALFGLGDEYTDSPACYYEEPFAFATGPSDLLGIPNLTIDPDGAKWANVMHGAEEGGRRYGECIYHPTDSCRMLDTQSDELCRVCKAEVRLRIAMRRDPTLNDGPPLCVLGSKVDPHALKGTWPFELRMFDRTPIVRMWVALDNVQIGPVMNYGNEALVFPFEVPVSPGKHVLVAECTDRFGVTSRARIDAFAN